jgi:class 3 adenylate cyclase
MAWPQFSALNLRTKIFLAMLLVALTVVGAILAINFKLRRDQLLAEFQVFVRGVAGTTALALSGDDVATVHAAADAATPAFLNARQALESARKINGLAESEIYILRPLSSNGFETEFVVMLQRETFIGNRYIIPESNRPVLLRAWTSGMPASTGMYRDENGRWISGYAPVFGHDGKPVAIIEVDAELSRFITKQRNELLLALAVGLGALCFAVIPGLLLAGHITRGVNKLSEGMKRFKSGENQVQVAVAAGDEIGQLAAVFNEMIVSLQEKLSLLTYVSRFTADAVRRSREDPSWLTGMEHDVIVLFADLRGFTSFSESREAGALVQELNRLLAVQADVVVSSGGDVDKFIGDAVMAVFFSDENERASETVFECARRLIERVHDETVSSGSSLPLGVGIHRGRAIVGSIGSATRRDFTAIGHTVNLAARLCERAGPWEILVSDSFLRGLATQTQELFVRTEPIQFKNVQQAVPTFRYSMRAAFERGDALAVESSR